MIGKRVYIVGIIVICATLILSVVVAYEYLSPKGYFGMQRNDLRKTEQGENVHYTTLQGEPISLHSFEGAVLVINIWASWSPFSKDDFAILSTVQKKYGDNIHVLAINRMEPKETAQAYISAIQAPQNLDFILDNTDHFFKTIDGFAMPETIVYDALGNELFHKRGVLDLAELEAVLDAEVQK
jgi:thiol-disulfide isomerase/thioredoxin